MSRPALYPVGHGDKMIGMQDADGIALAAIQGLNQRLEGQRQSLDEQQQRIAELEDSVLQLETLRSEIAVLRQALTFAITMLNAALPASLGFVTVAPVLGANTVVTPYVTL